MTTTLRRHYTEVAEGETVHAYGVPFVITKTAATTSHGATYMVGTYRGPDLGSYNEGNNLAPFVRRDGDEWTFQLRTDIAEVISTDGGETWHCSHR